MWTALILAVGVALFIGAIMQYNAVIAMRQRTRNAWSDVDVYLKRRADLVPNLVEAVKAYASHESTLFEAIATARSSALGAGTIGERSAAESDLASRLGRALILAENYPDLKATTNFENLQRELSETETKIASARQYYNACVRDLNTMTEAFPSGLIASIAGVKPAEFFEADSAERNAPRVN